MQLGQVGTSDGTLEQLGLVVLEDDKDWQNAENLVPVVNTDFLDENHEVADVAQQALRRADDRGPRPTLNAKVDGERQQPEDVAEDYLTEKGLI